MKTITTCALALAAALAVAAPAAAAAKPKPATFKLEIKGEQLTTWTYEKDMQPSCDWPESAAGRQYISFGTYDFGDTARPKVKAKRTAGGGVALEFLRDDITLTAEAEAERHYRSLYTQQSECPGGGGPYGGGDGPVTDAVGTDRCREIGELDLYLGSSIEEVEDPSYPTGLTEAKPPKAPLFFAGGPYWGSLPGSSLPADCSESGQPNADIGIVESQGEWAGAVIPAGSSLKAKRLLDPKRKRTEVEFSRTVAYPNEVQTYGGPPHTTGKTTMDATFTFTRVGR
jgi:hypothetical protein